MTSRKVATARRCRVGPACAYPAIRGGWPTALVSKAGSRFKRDKAIEQPHRPDHATVVDSSETWSLARSGAFLFTGKSARSSLTHQRAIAAYNPARRPSGAFSAREALAQCSYLMNDAGRPHAMFPTRAIAPRTLSYLEIIETVTLISDTPRILTFVPDTRRMKSSSP
jgi:hypothetical protein